MIVRNKINFWRKLDKPFFCLAPMADVTDIAFRAMLAKYGKNSENKNQVVFWTEFVSADGLCNKVGRKHLAHILKFSKAEKPIVAQVFGAQPENMEKACRIISKLGFDGVDINMGCPDKSVVRQGAGSALIRTPALAREIIRSAILGADGLPVSVKTRVGFNKDELDTWIPELLKEDISALTIHARTKKQMSKVPADWNYVRRVVEMVKKSGKNTCPNLPQGRVLVIGNGDVENLIEAKKRISETDCDGVMVGRGVFGNPWFFSGREDKYISIREKVLALKEHIKIFDKKLLKTKDKTFSVMKKHFKSYINGFDGAKELRNRLMETETPKEALSVLTTFQKTLK
ncbi:MAG: tRNA-dihydrouridine synthase family protein [bacterium]